MTDIPTQQVAFTAEFMDRFQSTLDRLECRISTLEMRQREREEVFARSLEKMKNSDKKP